MSSLRARQIQQRLRTSFECDIDLYGITEKDKERDLKILTRCLAAFAIYNATGCQASEAALSVWDGGDDNGIDAAYYDASENQVVIAQSKWIQSGSGEPSANEVNGFIVGVKDLIEGTLDNFGDRLNEKVKAISDALMIPGTTVRMILISTGASSLSEHSHRHIKRLLEELNEDDDGIATFDCMGMEEVFSGLSGIGSAGKTNLSATLLDWNRVSHPHKAYYGIIDASQLKAWWINYGKRLVAKNIRYSLGDTEVNLQIAKTADTNPEHFWYFNNGITLIADEATRAPALAASHTSGNFEFIGASIVNGAQTVSTLAKVTNDAALGQVKVSIRVVILKDAPANFGGDVTRTNNLQNRVEGRDFVLNDYEQTRIKEEMSVEGIDYQFHRSGDFIPSPTSCDLIEVTTALACASHDVSHSVAVKTGIGRFFNDLSKAPYKSMFNPQTSGARAFNATRVLRVIEDWIAEKKASAPKRSGYSWGGLIHGNRAIASSVFNDLGSKLIDVPIIDFDPDYVSKVKSSCEKVYPKIVEQLEDKFPNKSLAVLFKSPNNCKILFDGVASGINK